jgi:hypothetical protein
MALKLTKTTETGFTSNDAYHRVENTAIYSKNKMAFVVKIYNDTNKESFDAKTFTCEYDLNGENPIKQAYLHLKTLPEFEGAVDC